MGETLARKKDSSDGLEVDRVGESAHIKKAPPLGGASSILPGGDLLSQTVASQVPSALKGLTSVFGMGTGVTPSPLPPENFEILFSAAYLIVSQLDTLVKT